MVVYSDEGLIVFELQDSTPNTQVNIGDLDVSTDISSHTFTRVSTDRLSTFSIELNNPKGKYNKDIKEGDVVLIYLDNENGDTLQFRGKVDSSTPGLLRDYFIRVTGRDRPELIDMRYTGTFDDENIVDFFEAVITDLNNRAGYTVVTFDSDNFPTTSATISSSFDRIPYLEVLKKGARKAGWEFYIDTDEGGSIKAKNKGDVSDKVDDAIMSGVNFMGTDGISNDSTYQKNAITVHGDNFEGCLVMWYKGTSSFTPWMKEEDITDASVRTRQQAQDRVTMDFNEFSVARKQGSIRCTGLPSLVPTKAIDAHVTYVIDGTFQIKEYTDSYSINGFESSVVLEQLSDIDIALISENSRRIKDIQSVNDPNAMKYAYHFTFDNEDDQESAIGVTMSNGKLKLNSDIDQGTWESKALTLPENVTQFEVRVNGNDDSDLSTFEASANNGETKDVATVTELNGNPGTLGTFTTSGKKVKIKITLNSDTDNPSPALESADLLIK